MFWDKLFKKSTGAEGSGKAKLPKPKEMIDVIGIHLVAKMKQEPDWVWGLHCVTKPREGGKHVRDVRVFSRRQAQIEGVVVVDYHSLDPHPHLIIFEGRFDRENRKVVLEDKRTDLAA